jgi:hypothetical protein
MALDGLPSRRSIHRRGASHDCYLRLATMAIRLAVGRAEAEAMRGGLGCRGNENPRLLSLRLSGPPPQASRFSAKLLILFVPRGGIEPPTP